ncbi:MAG: Fe-S cluster assembly protein SufB [Candidatus Absconditabacterales bacterium]|nr:Fe-S cluster assembly protein SufB [Candidatus Absconditabacterales bacterium]
MSDLQKELNSASNIEYELFLNELTEETIRKISADQNEPQWMLDHRLASFAIFKSKKLPNRGPDLSKLDFGKIVWYAKPKKDGPGYARDRNDVPADLKEKFEKLGIPQAEREYLAGAGGQMDSNTVYHKLKEQREQKGVIFEDMAEAVTKHEALVRRYFMKLVPNHDHLFAALHGAVWSGGTFIYVPKGIKMTQPLQAYFRMNTYGGGQFEHTLIVVEDDAQADYIEGCSAPKFDTPSLHAGMVEVYVGKNAKMKYSSVENWSFNTYNLNTKRALVDDDGYMEWVGGNMGSCTTMLYPCTILKGERSKTDILGVAVAGQNQVQDVGGKVIHIGKHTSSKIVSKSIAKDGGSAIYRGLVQIMPSAENAHNATECDALLMDDLSTSSAVPSIDVQNDTAVVAHEASAGKIDEKQLFYLMSRGIDEDKALSMIVNGFFSSIVKKLPLEYASEVNKLIEMEMEGSVG